jgi:ubiquinone/menaquinone biosynthesis C-methylase UbiE
MKRNSTIDIWENSYRQGRSILLYPDSDFITLAHHLLKKGEHNRILDYSFGSGANMMSLVRRGFKVSGVEVSSTAIRIVRRRLKKENLKAQLTVFNGTELPFKDGTFDAVIAWEVLDYNTWDSLKKALKEIDRVLRTGGKLICTFSRPQDGLVRNARKMGNCLYRIKNGQQQGCIKMALDRTQLRRCFPSRNICVGQFVFEYKNLQLWQWIVTYEKK